MKPSDTNFGNAILACTRLVGIRLDPIELHDLNSKYELKSVRDEISFPMLREKTDAILNTIGLSNHEWHSNADEALLPFLYFSNVRGWVVVHGRNSLNDWMITEFGKKSKGEHSLISSLSGMPILKINADTRLGEASSIRSVVKRIMREHKGNLFDATIASIFINLLALVTSTFSMQVYDRVIPTQGVQTLVVLSAGVLLSIVFDMIIKATKTKLLEEVIVDWDSQLSSVVFRRLLSVRVDHLPRMIGTLSAQLRGYETIRMFLTSAPMFLFVDLPFAFLFVFVIGFIGGIYMALVPIVFLIVSVVTGLIFKRKIEKSTLLWRGSLGLFSPAIRSM